MPYLLNGKPTITPGRSFRTADGSTITNEWTKVFNTEELAALGVTWQDDPAWFDKQWYWNANTPKDIADLKPVKLAEQKAKAAWLLAKYDWYVTRKAETDTAIPEAVTTYRAAVRTACAAREAEIAAASTTPALKTLMETPAGQSGALTQWPTEPS